MGPQINQGVDIRYFPLAMSNKKNGLYGTFFAFNAQCCTLELELGAPMD
jgi:hypothetical protein